MGDVTGPISTLLSTECQCEYDDYDDEEPPCPNCHGDGRDPWNDYCTPCESCGGEG